MRKIDRPKLTAVPEEMRRLCASLGEELLRWPDVQARAMFGMRAFYRGRRIFALLPDKRGMESPTAIAYKLTTEEPSREGRKWRLLELVSGDKFSSALAVLSDAYRKARVARDRRRTVVPKRGGRGLGGSM